MENCLWLLLAWQNYPAFLPGTQWAPASALLVPVQLPTNSEAAITNESVHNWKEWSQWTLNLCFIRVKAAHCQLVYPCIHSRVRTVSSRAEITITRVCVTVHI